MKSTLIGFALAAIILIAIFAVPTFLPASVPAETVEALKQAELGRRQLHAYNSCLALTAAKTDIAALKQADFQAVAEAKADDVAALKEGFRSLIRNAQTLDRESGLTASNLRELAPNAAGISAFENAARDNQKRLAEADKNAQQAVRTARDAAAAGKIAGVVKLTEAGGLLNEALTLRKQAVINADRLLYVAAEWAQAKAASSHYAGLDLSEVDATLNDDIEEIAAQLDETSGALRECEQAIDVLKSELDGVREQTAQRQSELMLLTEEGFTLGDDEAFQNYREKYLALTNQLRDLESSAQLLTHGGFVGAEVAGDDWFEGEMTGGKPVVGLEDLEHNADMLSNKMQRLEKSREALVNKQADVTKVDQEARTRQAYYNERLAQLQTEFAELLTALTESADQAASKEGSALKAANAAVSSFKTEKSAVDGWKNNASSLQREKDPQRINDRLKMIAADSMSVEGAANDEAQALLLVGRIAGERAIAMRDRLAALEQAAALAPDLKIAGLEELREAATQARDEAVESLTKARDAYERLSQKQSDSSWAPMSSLAAAYHLLWRIDSYNAPQHRSAMIEQLGQAVKGREEFPYLKQQAALYAAVTADGSTPALPQSQDPADEPESETTEED